MDERGEELHHCSRRGQVAGPSQHDPGDALDEFSIPTTDQLTPGLGDLGGNASRGIKIEGIT